MRYTKLSLFLVLAVVTARADEKPVDDVALVLRAYQGLTTAKHVLPTDAKLVAEAAVAALSSGSARGTGFGSDASANVEPLERQARALLAKKRPPAARAAVWSSIRAMVSAANDPHTFLFEPALAPTLTKMMESKAAAAPGAELALLADGRFVVTEVDPHGPAAKAGLKPGDVLREIDGRTPSTLPDIFTLYGRSSAAPLPLRIERPGSTKPVDLSFKAFDWKAPIVDGRLLPGAVGYVRLHYFAVAAADLMRRKIEDLQRAGARALVLDLRGNFGGVPDMVPSLFTDADPIVILRDGAGRDEPMPRNGEPLPRPLPTVILVDSGTFSAAEFLAFALQDRRVALVMGTPTGGGLTGVDDIELADGYLLHVATTLVVGPVSHVAPAGHRVTPDKLLPERAPQDLAAGIDHQLEAAVAEAVRKAGPGGRPRRQRRARRGRDQDPTRRRRRPRTTISIRNPRRSASVAGQP